MFGFGKKKKCKCDEDCCKPKIEIHEIVVENHDSDSVASELLSHILTPFMNKICDKLHQEGKKGKEAQDKAFKEFDKLLKCEEDFNPWHIAAVLIQNNIFTMMDKDKVSKDKKSNVKKKDTRKDTRKSTKKSSPKK